MTDTNSISQSELDALWDFSDAEGSAARFREAIADPSRTDLARSVLETQLARALGLAGRHDQAEAFLDAGPATVGDDLVQARVALERGRLLVSREAQTDAVAQLILAARQAAAAGSPFLALDALHMLALVDAGHEEEWAADGLAMVATVSQPRVKRWGVALHNNLGWHLHDTGRPADALTHFEQALEVANAVGTDDQRFIGQWAIARCLRSLGRADEALAIQQRLAALRPEDEFVQKEIAVLTGVGSTIES